MLHGEGRQGDKHDMVLNPTVKCSFYFLGYADHRHSEAPDNKELSQNRADAVETIVRRTLFTTPNPSMQSQGLGVDANDPVDSTDSKTLATHRRVDIIGPKLLGLQPDPPPPPKQPPPKVLLSHTWKARLRGNTEASLGPLTGDRFYVDIVDVENKLKLVFVYKGLGMGLSKKPIGFSYSTSATKWTDFTTEDGLALSDFEGFAFHTAAPGGDLLLLTLAHATRPHSWVKLLFAKFTILDATKLSGGQTGGTLEPEYRGPLGGSVPWDPNDPKDNPAPI